jgi:hypothetical protein
MHAFAPVVKCSRYGVTTPSMYASPNLKPSYTYVYMYIHVMSCIEAVCIYENCQSGFFPMVCQDGSCSVTPTVNYEHVSHNMERIHHHMRLRGQAQQSVGP